VSHQVKSDLFKSKPKETQSKIKPKLISKEENLKYSQYPKILKFTLNEETRVYPIFSPHKLNYFIVKIDSVNPSFCLRHYVQNGLSYLAEETRPKLC